MDRQAIENKLSLLALAAASILGLFIRLTPVLQNDLPINDGSLFVQMAEEIIAAGFSLPDYTGYNLSQIPLAYPPFGFYLAAVIARVTSLDPLIIIRFLPAAFSWLTIPAFYITARKMLGSALASSAAVIIFALIPRSWLWLVMGGGVTRSPGLLFSILTLYFGFRLFTQIRERFSIDRHLVAATICYALAVLSHPEAVIFGALSLGLLFLVFNRTKTGFFSLLFVGFGALATTSPWWLTILLRHGIAPFLAAAKTSNMSTALLDRLILFNFTGEAEPALFAVLAVIAVFFCIAKRDLFLPILAIATIILLPVSGLNYLSPIVAMLAALAIAEVILPAISAAQARITDHPAKPFSLLSVFLLAYFFVNLFFSGLDAGTEAGTSLRAVLPEERAAMQWIRTNIPPDSRFLVLSDTDWRKDTLGEWFPYLTQRRAVNVLTGAEWLPGGEFGRILTYRNQMRGCLSQSLDCIEGVQASSGVRVDFIYLVKQNQFTPSANTLAVENELRQTTGYTLLYDGPAGSVYASQP